MAAIPFSPRLIDVAGLSQIKADTDHHLGLLAASAAQIAA